MRNQIIRRGSTVGSGGPGSSSCSSGPPVSFNALPRWIADRNRLGTRPSRIFEQEPRLQKIECVAKIEEVLGQIAPTLVNLTVC
jgi:hypothetical protein